MRLKISKVVEGSQADALKLMKGDIILRYAGKTIREVSDLNKAKESAQTDQVEMVILRGDKEMTLALKSGQIGIFMEKDYY